MQSEEGVLLDLAAGRLVAPWSPNTLDLALALAHLGGVRDVILSEGVRQVLTAAGEADRYVFLLLDGLGFELLSRHRPNGFLSRHHKLRLRAVCPSGTTASLTTLATGLWPAEHGLTSWWTHLPDLGVTATVPPLLDRITRDDLDGTRAMAELFSAPLLAGRFTQPVAAYFPRALAARPYACYLAGGRPASPYDRLNDLLERLFSGAAEGRTRVTYVYAPDIDKAAHRYGCDSVEVRSLIENIDRMLERLACRLGPDARLLVSADHGLVDVVETADDLIESEDPLAQLLRHAPSGERRFIAFHVREGRQSEFESLFERRFGESHHLLTVHQVRRLRLLGPELPEATQRRLGDFVAIPRAERTLRFAGDRRQAASHGGLTPAEMVVPFVVA